MWQQSLMFSILLFDENRLRIIRHEIQTTSVHVLGSLPHIKVSHEKYTFTCGHGAIFDILSRK